MLRAKFTAIVVRSVRAAFGTARHSSGPATRHAEVYQVAHDETDPHIKITWLDDFVTKYPDSPLMAEAYRDYYATYLDLRDYPRVIDYTDELVVLGDAVSVHSRILAPVFP